MYILMSPVSYFSIYHAPPTAELEPLSDGEVAQTDEVGFFVVVF